MPSAKQRDDQNNQYSNLNQIKHGISKAPGIIPGNRVANQGFLLSEQEGNPVARSPSLLLAQLLE